MRITHLGFTAAALTLLFAGTGSAGVGQLPVPNQDNVSVRANATVNNPTTPRQKQSAAVKRAQLRQVRDSLRTVTVLK